MHALENLEITLTSCLQENFYNHSLTESARRDREQDERRVRVVISWKI